MMSTMYARFSYGIGLEPTTSKSSSSKGQQSFKLAGILALCVLLAVALPVAFVISSLKHPGTPNVQDSTTPISIEVPTGISMETITGTFALDARTLEEENKDPTADHNNNGEPNDGYCEWPCKK
ncbi:expressed unknown protein [Seminavis robusta]|uniref:Uncharacterized protein n=1 Tax=Seminavis robusta TaxID=568900 RepID=A0A9N8E6Y2_9STRA|nr:expressed unknown protein [Seminavis robusta]|eukprot:Sro742_g195860.1 n/a (124) ;mRNA; f:12956-13327